MKKSKKEKVVTGVISTGVFIGVAFTGIYFAIPEVKEKVDKTVNDIIGKIKNKIDENKNDKNNNSNNNINNDDGEQQKTEERKDKIQTDERFEDFDDEIKEKILDEFDTIADSDEYKNMTDKEKDEIGDKLIESKVVQDQINVEQTEYENRYSEFKDKVTTILSVEQNASVEEISNNIFETKQELQDVISSDNSSLEQIAEAESKLKEIESVEQEFVYFETIESVTENLASNFGFNYNNRDIRMYQLKGIYMLDNQPYVSADFIKEEIVAGISIYSVVNQFVRIITDKTLTGNETYQEVWDIVSNAPTFIPLGVRNVNQDIHQEILEKNESLIARLTKLEKKGYELKVIESWDYGNAHEPSFMIKAKNEIETKLYVLSPTSDNGYRIDEIQKICPEFWAQVEAEQAQQTPEAQAQATVESYTTRDQNGNVTEFNYAAYQQDQANKAQKTQTSKETTSPVIYDLDLTR